MKQELGNLMAEDPQQETINLLTYRLNAVTVERNRMDDQLDEILLRLGRTQERMFNAERQRDRLADLVKQFIYILDITEESDSGRLFHPTNITSCRAGDLQKAGELVEALRRASRNQPTP